MKRAVRMGWGMVLGCALGVLATRGQAPVRQEIRIPDIPRFRTLKCDLHMHTVFSDGQVWPTWRVEEAWRDGLDAIALTDHIEYQPKTNDLPSNLRRPVELAAGAGAERDVIVIRGAEITKAVPPGHFNAIFLEDIAPLVTNDLVAQLEAARAQGAFVFWNHPGWRVKPGEPVILPIHESVRSNGLVQGAEIYNGEDLYTNAWPWALQHGLALLGNSDEHVPIDPPQPYHAAHRTLTLVFAKERSAAGIKEALNARRTAVWAGNVVAGAAELLEPLFKACVTVAEPHQRSRNAVSFKVRNDSDLSFSMTRVAGAGPARLAIPPGRTVLLKVAPDPVKHTADLEYDVDNLQTALGVPLRVKWTVGAAAP